MINKRMYEWIRDLSEDPNFIECVALTDRAIEERYDMDLVLRFVVLRTMDQTEFSKIGDMGDFLTDRMVEIAKMKNFPYREEKNAFTSTFEILRRTIAGDSFRKFDTVRNKFSGGFLVSGFEVVALGVGYNYKNTRLADADIRSIVANIWRDEQFTSKSGSGVRASSRVPNTVPLGRRIFDVS